jgi:hypothetical protein
VRSIPASARIEVCYYHEPEGTHDDNWGDKTVAGPRFVSEFRAEQATISAVNQAIPVVFIGGGYQYSGGAQSSRGIGGHFIPPTADYHYMDTHQTDTIIPASQTPSVRSFIAEVGRKGGPLNGFSDYARGVAPLSSATIQARIKVFATDSAWLRSRPGIRAWCQWNTTDQDGRQWRLMDAASQTPGRGWPGSRRSLAGRLRTWFTRPWVVTLSRSDHAADSKIVTARVPPWARG